MLFVEALSPEGPALIVLGGNCSRELATALTVEVEATYAMVPSKGRIDPTLDHHTWHTTRNASVFGVDRPLPPFTSEMIDAPKEVFPRFIANSGTMGRMLLRSADNEILVAESGLNHSQVEALFPGRHIATKSRVTMVRDFPVYDFDAFNKTLLDRSKFLVRLSEAISSRPWGLDSDLRTERAMFGRYERRTCLRAYLRPRGPFRELDRV